MKKCVYVNDEKETIAELNKYLEDGWVILIATSQRVSCGNGMAMGGVFYILEKIT